MFLSIIIIFNFKQLLENAVHTTLKLCREFAKHFLTISLSSNVVNHIVKHEAFSSKAAGTVKLRVDIQQACCLKKGRKLSYEVKITKCRYS